MNLAHYIFVRRDLPIGTIAAMITHAAGESGAKFYDTYGIEFEGGTAVVLEAKNEAELTQQMHFLEFWHLSHVNIIESSGPYANQLMAVGMIPIEREQVHDLMQRFQLLKSCLDNSPVPSLQSKDSNEHNETETPTTPPYVGV